MSQYSLCTWEWFWLHVLSLAYEHFLWCLSVVSNHNKDNIFILERFSYDLEKGISWVFVICFVRQWLIRSKQFVFRFPRKQPYYGKWNCLIDESECEKLSDINEKIDQSIVYFDFECKIVENYFFCCAFAKAIKSQPRLSPFVIRSLNQPNRDFSYCSRVIISRSYENRSILAYMFITFL